MRSWRRLRREKSTGVHQRINPEPDLCEELHIGGQPCGETFLEMSK